jgi:hypothetical protein
MKVKIIIQADYAGTNEFVIETPFGSISHPFPEHAAVQTVLEEISYISNLNNVKESRDKNIIPPVRKSKLIPVFDYEILED